jgi:hypothetical protein
MIELIELINKNSLGMTLSEINRFHLILNIKFFNFGLLPSLAHFVLFLFIKNINHFILIYFLSVIILTEIFFSIIHSIQSSNRFILTLQFLKYFLLYITSFQSMFNSSLGIQNSVLNNILR